jgi:ABC-type branched-subunit amino acid transport system substrate-binding protein
MKKIVAAAAVAALVPSFAVAQDAPLKIGVVSFLSGAAAGPFGVPARNGAEIMIEMLNAGKVPAPYATKGFGGAPLQMNLVDESGGTTTQVTEFRNMVQRDNVDMVIGYISSGSCLGIAPVAEELKKITVFFDCGTPRIFEERSYKYVFRTALACGHRRRAVRHRRDGSGDDRLLHVPALFPGLPWLVQGLEDRSRLEGSACRPRPRQARA